MAPVLSAKLNRKTRCSNSLGPFPDRRRFARRLPSRRDFEFVGVDVVWDPRPGTAFDHIVTIGGEDIPAMPAGEPVVGGLFPVVTIN
jgi:hypothetical protein